MFGLFKKRRTRGFTFQEAFAAVSAAGLKRSFEEIQSERILNNWFTSEEEVNLRLAKHLIPLRRLSRSLAESNPYAIRYLDLCVTNIVGDQGFKIQSRVANADGSKDKFARREIENEWLDWMHPENCTLGGATHWNDFDRMNERTLARDGEVFLEVFPGYGGNLHRFAVRSFDPSLVDPSLNVPKIDGSENRIVLGKEITPAGRCVAFYLLASHPGAQFHTFDGHGGKKYIRRPALCEFLRADSIAPPAEGSSYILHQFVELEPGQQRGLPTMAAAIQPLRHLERTEEAHHTLARLSACMGYQEISENADVHDFDPDYLGEAAANGQQASTTDENGFYRPGSGGSGGKMEISPAFIAKPGNGKKFETLMPVAPNTALPAHGEYTLQGTASYLGVTYASLSGNLKGTSYNSGRAGSIIERDGFKIKQDNSINGRIRPIFHTWLRVQILFNNLQVGKVTDIGERGERRLRAAHVQGRRWDWVDPLKDSMGRKNDLEIKITSPQRVTAERGLDWEEILEEWEEYNEVMSDKGLTVNEDDGESVARTLQQIYLAVGKVITPEEARDIVNKAGGNLPSDLPERLSHLSENATRGENETSDNDSISDTTRA